MSWVAFSLAAIGFQTTRNGLARSLSGQISPLLNSWARFAFTLPLAALLVAVLVVALVPRGGDRRFFWATYLKPVGRITRLYMGLIDPFRRWLIYPAILRHVHRTWHATRVC